MLTTADFLLPYVAAGCFGILGAVTGVWGLLWVSGVLVVLALPMLVRLVKMRSGFREMYPLGRMLEAGVTPEALTLALRHGISVTPWGQYEAVKATDSVVLLRHRRRRFGSGSVEVLPLELFGPEELRTIAAAVPRRF